MPPKGPEEEKEQEILQVDDQVIVKEELIEDDDRSTTDDPPSNGKRHMSVPADAPWKDRMWEVFTTFWSLGFVREE